MAKLLADPRDRVRWQAMIHAPEVPELLQPVLRAVLAEPENGGPLRSSEAYFDHFLRVPGLLPAALSEVLSAKSEGPPAVRKRAATILGHALEIHGREFEAGGFKGPDVVRHLLYMAVADSDASVGEVAAAAAAMGDNAVDDVAWPALVRIVTDSSGSSQVAALRIVGRYLVAARKPSRPRDIRIQRDDEGRVTFSGEFFPKGTNWPPHVVPQLIDWVLTLPAESSLQAARELMNDDQGVHDMPSWVYAKLDQRDFEPVRRLADALCAVRPDFVNAPWWRAQALVGLGADADACTDLEVVLKMTPDFEPAKVELVEACVRLAHVALADRKWDDAISRARRAMEVQPDAPDPHHVIAAGSFNAGRFADAEASASRVIELRSAFAEAWWVRAMAREQLGRNAEARQDALQAVQLNPEDKRFAGYLSRLETGSS
jgi:tetratricopeptide (TPR) repeat protein